MTKDPGTSVPTPDAEEDDRGWLGKSIDRIDAMDEAAFEQATAATNRLARELDITNADHVALWLEANTIPDEPMSQCISWLACQIVEAHESANGRVRTDAAVAIADEIVPDTADGTVSPIQRQAYWHVAHRAAEMALGSDLGKGRSAAEETLRQARHFVRIVFEHGPERPSLQGWQSLHQLSLGMMPRLNVAIDAATAIRTGNHYGKASHDPR